MKALMRVRFVLAIALVAGSSLLAFGQANDTSVAPDPRAASGASTADTATPTVDPIEQSTRIQALGEAAWLQVKPGYLHLGALYLSSLSFSEGLDRFGSGANTETRNSSVFTANLFVHKRLSRYGQLAFQYAPNLYVIDGKVDPDFTHQTVSVSSAFALSGRTTLTINDQFSYAGQMGLDTTPAVKFDAASGNYHLGDFVQGAGNTLANSVEGTITHKLNARSSVYFTPSFRSTFSDYLSGQSIGARIGTSYDLSSRTSIGAAYSFTRNQYDASFATANYHSVEVNTTENLGHGFNAYIALGISTQPIQNTVKTAFTPTVRLAKAFRSASIFGTFTRTPSFYDVVQNGYSNQYGVGYTQALGRKVSTSVSFGAYGETQSTTDNSGKYGTVQVNYAFLPRFSVFSNFSRRTQSGDANSIFIGNRSSLMFGVSWSPSQASLPSE